MKMDGWMEWKRGTLVWEKQGKKYLGD